MNYAIPIATLNDWLKNLAPVFQPMRNKTKTNDLPPYTRDFSRASRKLQVIARNADWFIALFGPIWLVFRQSFENRSDSKISL